MFHFVNAEKKIETLSPRPVSVCRIQVPRSTIYLMNINVLLFKWQQKKKKVVALETFFPSSIRKSKPSLHVMSMSNYQRGIISFSGFSPGVYFYAELWCSLSFAHWSYWHATRMYSIIHLLFFLTFRSRWYRFANSAFDLSSLQCETCLTWEH